MLVFSCFLLLLAISCLDVGTIVLHLALKIAMWSIPLVQPRGFYGFRSGFSFTKNRVNTWPFHLLNVCRRTSGLIVLIQDTAQSFSSGGFFLLTPVVLMNKTFATHWRSIHLWAWTGFHYWLIVAIELHDKKDPEMIPLTVISIKVDETTIKHAARQHLYLDRQEYELFGISYSPGIHSRATAHTTDL